MNWTEELKNNITTAEELIEPLHLTDEEYRDRKSVM